MTSLALDKNASAAAAIAAGMFQGYFYFGR
jgi:hypothetical protein